MKRILIGPALMTLFAPSPALAAPLFQHGITAGATVQWESTTNVCSPLSTNNALIVGEGNGQMWGNYAGLACNGPWNYPAALPALGLGTPENPEASGIFTELGGGVCGTKFNYSIAPLATPHLGTGAGYQVYYTYLVCDNSGACGSLNAPQFLLTQIPPNRDGTPNLAPGAPLRASGCNGNPLDAIFIGSFMTDATNNILPFNRNGDEVRFSGNILSGNILEHGCGVQSTVFSDDAGAGPGSGHRLLFGPFFPAAAPELLPVTASAMLVEASAWTDEHAGTLTSIEPHAGVATFFGNIVYLTSRIHPFAGGVGVLDPEGIPQAQAQILVGPSASAAATGSATQASQYSGRIRLDELNSVGAGQGHELIVRAQHFPASGNTLAVNVVCRGYVESPQSMTIQRNP